MSAVDIYSDFRPLLEQMWSKNPTQVFFFSFLLSSLVHFLVYLVPLTEVYDWIISVTLEPLSALQLHFIFLIQMKKKFYEGFVNQSG